MNATTVAVDLAKNVFELALADARWKIVERARLTRAQFERWFDNRKVDRVVMEACGSAHHWARTLRARGIEVRLLPAQYVRCCARRRWRTEPDDLLIASRVGRSQFRRAPITTRPPALWPTSSRASPGRSGSSRRNIRAHPSQH